MQLSRNYHSSHAKQHAAKKDKAKSLFRVQDQGQWQKCEADAGFCTPMCGFPADMCQITLQHVAQTSVHVGYNNLL